ncbi:MAG: hypothetical protein HY888_09705 [Deltaproteobacteria bacterium]|nr:hypothetical protein [Deltaproteobacteria bacterium]
MNPETVLHLPSDQLNAFFPLLQSGVTVPSIVGCTLKSLLCDQFAIPADYVTDRITTVFLDNRPVDNLEQAIIQDGSRVTLSAAMPGLVGATMRRGGYYAALRRGISHAAGNVTASGTRGTIRMKLFNLLLAELGPLVLAHGLILKRDELDELLINLPKMDKPVLHSLRDGMGESDLGHTCIKAIFGE